jgi:ribonuclease BN (tRNA processing enzyme)
MRLTVVGCSPAWPNPSGAHSGYLVEEPGSVLLDCGPGVLARLRAGGGWPEVRAIAITHFHLDHWGDLVPWVWGAMYRGVPLPRPELWLPPGGAEQLEHFGALLGFPDMFERVFELRRYEPGVPFEVGAHTITAARVPHYLLESHAFRVADGERTLVYSGDSAPSDELVETARGADLFLCEATLLEGALDATPRGHLSLDEALEAFRASGAGRLLVTHRPGELPAEGVELARDGLVVDV